MITQYGFTWGNVVRTAMRMFDGTVTVERAAAVTLKRGTYRSLIIKTDRQVMQVDITPTGLIRPTKPWRRRQ